MRVGIVGLSQSGKSSLFTLLTKLDPFKTKSGVMKLEDERLRILSKIFPDKKIVYPEIAVLDLGGVKEDSLQDLDTKAIKDVDVFIFVLRAFAIDEKVNSENKTTPETDFEVLKTAFTLADLELAQKSIDKIKSELIKGKKDREKEYELLKKIAENLEKENLLRKMNLSQAEELLIRGYKFLSEKPIVIVLNISEKFITNPNHELMLELAKSSGIELILSCLKAENEISQLEAAEQPLFMQELGIKEFCIQNLAKSCFRAFWQIFFFTIGEKEIRAWPIKQGTSALLAAGKIHSDMQKGFIKAQVIAYEQFLECGNFVQAKAKGMLRPESKDYLVQDADIIEVKFSN